MAIEDNTFTETGSDGTETEFEITTAKAEDLSGDDSSFAEAAVEAMFDDGSADHEASYIDADGDGKLDTGAADTDGDGRLDTASTDIDGDGQIDAIGKDTDGDGQLDTIVSDTDGDGTIDAAGMDTDGDGKLDVSVFDTDGDGEADLAMTDDDGDGTFEEVELSDAEEETDDIFAAADGLPTEEEISTNSVEFTVGADGFPITDDTVEVTEVTEEYTEYSATPETDVPSFETPAAEPFVTASPVDAGFGASETSTAVADEAAADAAAQQEHVDAAKEGQAAADEFVAQGDYAAAAEAREAAENSAYEAGDSSMLGTSDSSDLDNAAYKQEVADDYRAQQAENLADGDLEAAKEDAQNVGYAVGDADFLAGGADHTGQADNDEYNLNWAVDDEKSADQAAQNAEAYAAEGDLDNAQIYADRADGYQASSDEFAEKADVESDFYQADATSVVETGGTYDAASVGTYDAGTYDASIAAVDTGIDTSVDMSTPSTYDTTPDDTV